jgi:hypothetical protein
MFSPERRAQLSRLLREPALYACFVALALFHTGLWDDPAHRTAPGDDTPPVIIAVVSVARHLLTAPTQLFEYNDFFQYYNTGGFFEPLLGPAALVAPLTPFIQNPILLFNCSLVLVMATMSYGAYRLGLRLLGNRTLAILAALAVPYSGQQTGHYYHINVATGAGFPLLMLGMLRLQEEPGIGAALLTGLALGLQAGTSGYQAVSAAALIGVLVAWRPASYLRPKTLGLTLAALALGAAIMFPWASAFVGHQQSAGLVRGDAQSRHSSLVLANWFSSPSLLWRPILGNESDSTFPGAVVMILGVFGLFAARGRYAWLLRVTLVAFILLALGPDLAIAGHRLPLPLTLLSTLVPAVRACGHPSTFIIPGLMALAFLAMMGLARLGWTRYRVVAWLLGALIVAETFAPLRLVTGDASLWPVYEKLRTLPAGAFLEVPAGGWDEPEWEWRAIAHGLPVVNGSGPFTPPLQRGLYRLMKQQWTGRPARDLSDTQALAYLKRFFPIRYVVSHGDGWVARSVALTPSFVLQAEFSPKDRIYRLVRSGQGTWIERQFRDDQLRGRALSLRLRGQAGEAVSVSLNERPLQIVTLASTQGEWRVAVPGETLQRGLNAVQLESAKAFELIDIDTVDAR